MIADAPQRHHRRRGDATASPSAPSPLPDPARASVSFARTPLGDARVRAGPGGMPLHLARLLLLFEEPQAVEELRKMLDASWLPHALLELERRGLLRRIRPEAPASAVHDAGDDVRTERAAPDPDDGTVSTQVDDDGLAARRARTKAAFLRALGPIGDAMAERIENCRSGTELEQLLPQVRALLLALAGSRSLAAFETEIAAATIDAG
ncbi:MAG: hypothetical protein AB7P21_17010 [Lautropia sp.]